LSSGVGYNMNSFSVLRIDLLSVVVFLIAIAATAPAYGQAVSATTPIAAANGPVSSVSGQALPANGRIISGNGAYRLGPSDVIKVTVLKQDLLTQDAVRIDYDGNIRLPMLVEPVHAACLTESELAAVVTEQYRKYLLNPQVFVTIQQFNSNSISVIGAVTAPGRFQLQRPIRLLEVLALVNGPSATASNEVQILRTSSSDYCSENKGTQITPTSDDATDAEIISLKIDDVLSGSTESNPVLRGGDIIRVATAELKQAFIVGNIRTATTINLKDPVTLSTAIAMAGGPVAGAQLEKIKITRQSAESLKKNDIFVNLKEIRTGAQPDVLLLANDVVEVPGPSGTKKFLKNLLRTLVPVISGYPIILP
jgi:polysaccharide export outer membrane protein